MITFNNGKIAEAVIFDFDGVIVDTEPLHYRSFQKVLAPHGLGFSWQEYVDTYIGFDDRDAFKEAFRSCDKTLLAADLQQLISQKAVVFREVIQDGVTAYPGVVDLIKKLHTLNLPIAICSGALRSDIEPILNMLGISHCFDTIITADDVDISKPAPDCYQKAFEKLRSSAKSTISKNLTFAIEDTPAGIRSAIEAGLLVCAVSNSYSPEFLSEATFTVSSLVDILTS